MQENQSEEANPAHLGTDLESEDSTEGGSPSGAVGESESAPSGHYLPPPTLWEKITGWRGSFLVLSILFHVILIAVAAFLVVQVVKGREKMKFTAPPPSSAPKSQEHKVQMAKKKNSMSAPSMSKRITTTSTSANIALPVVQMSSSSSPDLMSSVMSGMGGAGLGAGFGPAGGGSAMPAGGLRAFGFKGAKGGGLTGTFYDLKQTRDRQPSPDIQVGAVGNSMDNHFKIIDDFVKSGWDPAVLDKFFKSKDPIVATQIVIPDMDANLAPQAFGFKNDEVRQSHWIIHYKVTVRAPRSGTFRFLGIADDVMLIRFDKQDVFAAFWPNGRFGKIYSPIEKRFNDDGNKDETGFPKGRWFTVEAGKPYQMDVLISEVPGGSFQAHLMIEERGKTYPRRKRYPKFSTYPVFQTKAGTPIPEYVAPKAPPKYPDNPMNYDKEHGGDRSEKMPEFAPEPIVFPAVN